jgi:hypothetical protein
MVRYGSWFTAMLSRAKKIPELQSILKTQHNEPKSRDEKIAGFRSFFGKANENAIIRKTKKAQRKQDKAG